MKWKLKLDIKLPDEAEPFDFIEKIKKKKGVITAHVIDAHNISISYNSKLVKAEAIIKNLGLKKKENAKAA